MESTTSVTFSNNKNKSPKTGSTIIAALVIILCANILDKDDSQSFLIIFDKVREHIWRGFDHSSMQNLLESLISLGYPPLQFKPQVFMGSKSGDWDGHCRTWLWFLISNFYVDFDVCLECRKIYLRYLSFLAEATRFSAKITWYLFN